MADLRRAAKPRDFVRLLAILCMLLLADHASAARMDSNPSNLSVTCLPVGHIAVFDIARRFDVGRGEAASHRQCEFGSS